MSASAKEQGPKRRILFIGKRFYTNKDALDERYGRIYQLPFHWAKSGFDVRLLLVDYHTREVRKLNDGALKVESTPLLDVRNLRIFADIWLRFRPEVVVASGDCYIGLLGWLLATIRGARFVFDIYDKYDAFAGYRPPMGVDLFGFLRRRSVLRFYASALLARSLKSGVGTADVVVPNGVDGGAFVPIPQQACREALGLSSGMKLIGYFGSMEAARGIGDLIEAVGYLRSGGADIRLLLCGKSESDLVIAQEWVIYRGLVPHNEVPCCINACDVVALPYRSSPLLDASASCKIAEYLMCRRPIVSTRTPNFLQNFPLQASELGPGLCTPQDPRDLARALAYQLREGALLSVPESMEWEQVAESAARKLHEHALYDESDHHQIYR